MATSEEIQVLQDAALAKAANMQKVMRVGDMTVETDVAAVGSVMNALDIAKAKAAEAAGTRRTAIFYPRTLKGL